MSSWPAAQDRVVYTSTYVQAGINTDRNATLTSQRYTLLFTNVFVKGGRRDVLNQVVEIKKVLTDIDALIESC